MSLKNPETVEEIIEKIMISCISLVKEYDRKTEEVNNLQDIMNLGVWYQDELKMIQEKGTELFNYFADRENKIV